MTFAACESAAHLCLGRCKTAWKLQRGCCWNLMINLTSISARPVGEAALIAPNSVSWQRIQESALGLHWRRDRRAYGARRTPRAYWRVGTHKFSFESDPAAAQNRSAQP